MTEDETNTGLPTPPSPETCKHEDTDRVGPFEIVCYKCRHIADWRKLLAGDAAAWKPIVSKKD